MARPSMSGLDFVHSPRPRLPADRVIGTLTEAWGIEGVLRDAGGDRDQNLVVTTPDAARYLVKIGQTGEDPGVLDLQLAALEHIATRAPELPVPRVVPTRAETRTHSLHTADGSHEFRVFTFLPGQPILDAKPSSRPPHLMRTIGALLARIDQALQGFFHPHAGHALLWDIRQAPSIRTCTEAIDDPGRRERVETILDRFTADILPHLDALPAQVIHGDATAENVLVDGQPPHVAGLIDFGDVMHAPRVQELAVAMADVTWNMPDPWTAACELAVGYDEVNPLREEEFTLLHDLACVRLAASAVVMASRDKYRAEGSGSMAALIEPGWRQLDALTGLGATTAEQQLRRALRLPAGPAVGDGAAGISTAEHLERRRHRLMPGLALFYPGDPLHVRRATGAWLFDDHGRRYLDCYNNVPQVGHAHPRVNQAVARQTAMLNTNTRYLYDSILDYADALAERMPRDLDVVLFVNSGSEANDLAWQMARAFTGNTGALVTAHAYHGGTDATAALSPGALSTGERCAAHVARLPVADSYRGTCGCGEAGFAASCRETTDQAIATLAADGHDPAAFIIDPTLSSDGILEPPVDYMTTVAEQVHAAGGLCIADEVQSGFGRLGTWWGFEARGLRPDIVTLGKPMANGYPMGAVVTTAPIMAAFAAATDYFSTFGGNPVACMAGLAVLDVIERDDLCAHARHEGQYLRQRLRELQIHTPAIGDVRGRGLFIGIDIVHPATARTPAAQRAAAIALELRRRGVLVGLEGPHANILKIRPPLAFRREHSDLLVQTLAAALNDTRHHQ